MQRIKDQVAERMDFSCASDLDEAVSAEHIVDVSGPQIFGRDRCEVGRTGTCATTDRRANCGGVHSTNYGGDR